MTYLYNSTIYLWQASKKEEHQVPRIRESIELVRPNTIHATMIRSTKTWSSQQSSRTWTLTRRSQDQANTTASVVLDTSSLTRPWKCNWVIKQGTIRRRGTDACSKKCWRSHIVTKRHTTLENEIYTNYLINFMNSSRLKVQHNHLKSERSKLFGSVTKHDPMNTSNLPATQDNRYSKREINKT